MPYETSVSDALTSLRDLRTAVEGLRGSASISQVQREALSTALTNARRKVGAAEPAYVEARRSLRNPHDHTARRACSRMLTVDTTLWTIESQTLQDWVKSGTLETYRRNAGKAFKSKSLPSLPLAAASSPLTDLLNQINVPGPVERVRNVDRFTRRQLRVIDSLIIILANTQNPIAAPIFEASFTLSTGVSMHRG